MRTIDARVAEPGLSFATVAGFAGLSEAEVRRLFDGTGEVFAERLEARRLDLALQRLRSSEWDHLSIAEIARRSGFADLSSFRRSFRARFGCMPSVARGRLLN